MVAGGLSAQEPPLVTLDSAVARSNTGFIWIAGLHELANGSVAILDSRDALVALLSADLATVRQVGREGQGPGEYRSPQAMFGLSRDRFGILDGAIRLLIFDSRGEPVDHVRLDRSAGTPIPTGSDLDGNLYTQALPVRRVQGGYELSDSSAIVTWGVETSPVDTAAWLPVYRRPGTVLWGSRIVAPPDPGLYFSTPAAWAPSTDGRVAVVESRPYTVTLYGPDGLIARRTYPFQPIQVRQDFKDRFCDTHLRGRNTPRRIFRDGATTAGTREKECSFEWPDRLPPLIAGAADQLRFDREGRLWVRRVTERDTGPLFDVFDESARLLFQARLPVGTRLVGFGLGAIYAARVDQYDLEFVERYVLP